MLLDSQGRSRYLGVVAVMNAENMRMTVNEKNDSECMESYIPYCTVYQRVLHTINPSRSEIQEP